MTDFFQKIKETYSLSNPNLLNLLKFEDFIELGYPEDIILKHNYLIKYAFPVVYPFGNINIKNKVILDLGAGVGLDSIVAINIGAKFVLSIDMSLSFLRFVKIKNNLKIKANILDLPLKENKIDIIIMNGSFNLIFNKTSLLKDLNVILKKGGFLIIGDLFWINTSTRDIYINDADSWSWCVGGGLTEKELFNMTYRSNFKFITKEVYEQIDILERVKYIFKNE